MENKRKILRCKIDLLGDDNTKCFTKGKEYTALNDPNSLDNIVVKDDTNTEHRLGNWFLNFNILK